MVRGWSVRDPRFTRLALNVLAPDGQPLWHKDETLSTVEILPRDRLFELPSDITHPLHLTLGDVVHLRGFDLDRTQATPGDTLSLLDTRGPVSRSAWTFRRDRSVLSRTRSTVRWKTVPGDRGTLSRSAGPAASVR